jgi:hypothetical protein
VAEPPPVALWPPPRAGWGWLLGSQGVVRPPLKAKTHKYFLGYFWILALGGGRTTPYGPMGGFPRAGWGWPSHPLGPQGQGVAQPPLRAKTHKYFLGYFWVLALEGGRTTPYGPRSTTNRPLGMTEATPMA